MLQPDFNPAPTTPPLNLRPTLARALSNGPWSRLDRCGLSLAPDLIRRLPCGWRIANFPRNQQFATHRSGCGARERAAAGGLADQMIYNGLLAGRPLIPE